MAYDSARGVTVLFGGFGDDYQVYDDTWHRDGTDWSLQSPSNSPPPNYRHAMVYASNREMTVLFNGGTWEYGLLSYSLEAPVLAPIDNPTGDRDYLIEWSTVTEATGYRLEEANSPTFASPTVRYSGPAISFTVTRQAGGDWYYRVRAANDTGISAWSNTQSVSVIPLTTNWTERFPVNRPPSRRGHAMAYDSARGVTVLFGGEEGAGYLSDTWEWDGTNWIQKTPANRPSARAFHAMAYDSQRGVTVLFGGVAGSLNFPNDTWEWDGANWTQRQPVNSPPGRNGGAMAYDSARGVTVFFGGTVPGQFFRETWEWDGANWSEREVNSPAGRTSHAMAYDSGRGVVVLFGGMGPDTTSRETWEWDGTGNWTRCHPADKPRFDLDTSMAYDSLRGVTVLFGGFNGVSSFDDGTYEWDGTNWNLQTVDDRPAARSGYALVYDSVREVVVLFGGIDDNVRFNDTWEYGPVQPPDPPVLSPINNPDGDGDYLIEWSAVTQATGYTLEEDNSPTFASPTVRYNGPDISFTVTGQAVGAWYYRVRAFDDVSHSAWSNVESVEVLGAGTTRYIYLPLMVKSAP